MMDLEINADIYINLIGCMVLGFTYLHCNTWTTILIFFFSNDLVKEELQWQVLSSTLNIKP
jgi:hypothetical protein